MEIERKFLVSETPPDLAGASVIEQGYLVIGADGSEARVRRRSGVCTLTVKSGTGIARGETEISITADQFEALWPATEGRRIEKTRYVLDAIELDVYAGELDGLIVAEVEFPHVAAAFEYDPPGWFGEEVTTDDRYKNRRLAVEGRPVGPSGN
jgi:CYTH domain-containing protein